MLDLLEKKETKIVALILSLVLLVLTIVMLVNQNTIKQTKDSHTHEAGKELVLNVKDFFEAEEEIIEEMTIDASNVNANQVGKYEATATYKSKKYTIDVKVVDTTAPKVNFIHRYVFTNDAANVDFSSMMESTRDASECSAKLVSFERKDNLRVMDEKTLKSLTDTINEYAKAEDIKAIGTADIPTEEGIYRAVLEVTDAYENVSYEEIILILDKTAAKIEDVADKTVTVNKENLSVEPTVDKSEYIINDNVDGKIAAEDITTTLELRNEANHEWLVHVSYVDRAGNESKADFLIIVKEGNAGSANQGSATGNGGTSSQGGTNSGNNGSDTNKKPTNNLDVSTWVPNGDESVISPYMQMLIDAGYGNVVEWDTGSYGVLVHADYTANGKDGYDILKEYLAERDLEIVKSNAGIIDEDDDWYFYKASEVRELTKSYWDDGEIEWIE